MTFPESLPVPASTPPRPADLDARRAALESALAERILVLDGATGTAFQAADLTAEDFGGAALEGCNEHLCLTRPDVVDGIHAAYLAAGADVVETNTFGATPLVLAEYGLEAKAFTINRRAAEIARAACARVATSDRPRFVCGSMGPTTKAISVTGGVTFEALQDHFRVQALGLMAGGADYLLLETCQDTRNVKAGLLGIERAFEEAGWRLPVAVSATIEPTGTMLAGQDAEALAVSLAHADLLYLGLNCATGPDLMTDHVRTLAELARTRVACVPNAGLPDEEGRYTLTAEAMAATVGSFVERGWINLVGGCCGTTAAHVTALAERVAGARPRSVPHHHRAFVSGLEAVELTDDNRPLLVGERTNVLGSRKFKRLIAEGLFEEAAEVGRAQVRAGAQVVDVCLQDPDRDEVADAEAFLDKITRLVKVPLMLDSTDPEVMERGLTWCQGKAILNSINLEDGRARFERVVPLARRYGAALVVGTIDEQGMAVTVERKLEVARRSYDILVDEMGIVPEDLWWDALVFPCGTGDAAYLGSAAATIEGVRRLHEEFPESKTILGVSNVSFGLPPAGREVLNSVFLHHATKAGLDAAIVNSERLARYAEIPEEERRLAEALLDLAPGDVAAGERAVEAFAAHFRDRETVREVRPRESLPLDERLARAVVEGSKVGLEEDLAVALDDPRWPEPLDIINGPLMIGMAEVGRLFNDNQLIVAEVLQSAEVMKKAVAFLEPHMERVEGAESSRGRGRVLLATVKGDVHDIGKNLVDIILSNNGFEVINLGIKVPSEVLIQAAREHRPDVIGLSGLLVKSAQQMVATAGDLATAGVAVPILVGGAALTRRFTHRKIAPAYGGAFCSYAKDAMNGLSLVERLCDPESRPALEREVAEAAERDREREAPGGAGKARPTGPAPEGPSPAVRRDLEPPAPPDLERHVEELPLDEVWELVNPQMLYAKHLGLKGSIDRLEEQGNPKLAELRELIRGLQEEAIRHGARAQGVWRFFPARVDPEDANRLVLLDPTGSPSEERALAAWTFPRQATGDHLCLADYVLPGDHVALFVTTFGGPTPTAVQELSERWKRQGEYLKSHAYAALALETAEAAAEHLHRSLRARWGFPDPEGLGRRDLFAAHYRGKRYSFGYPACPDLAGQRALFAALRPEEIGVTLTEGDMMEPEASVSALVFHHPDARYYGA